jgi:peptide/nickel transport system substrate-binding protein
MVLFDGMSLSFPGKGYAFTKTAIPLASVFIALVSALASTSKARGDTVRPVEFLLEQPPASLNPRSTLDAIGQRINALLYSGLTRNDKNLVPEPDLADRWDVRKSGTEIHFHIHPGLRDHDARPITASDLEQCLEQYRVGKPVSPYSSSFPLWKGTRHVENEVILELEKPDPYILRNLTLLRFFRVASQPVPCSEPRGAEAVIGSGPYRMSQWDPLPEVDMNLVPLDAAKRLPVHIQFMTDENTRVLKMLRGEVDLTLDTLGLAKIRWMEKNHSDRFRLIERRSTRVGYMAFNLRDPILANRKVRKAIALSIDRESIVRNKMFGFASLAGSLLAPELPESTTIEARYDPEAAEKLLDEAGYPRREHGVRFELHYKTTPVREGFENALMFREMLGKVGIKIILEVVEPAVFLQSVRKGGFQLFSSRWIGVADGSILYRTLFSKSPDNRVGYKNEKVDELLQKAVGEMDLNKRAALMQEVQRIMAQDLPYFPLWFWYQGLLVRKDHPVLSKIQAEDLSLSGALEPLFEIR